MAAAPEPMWPGTQCQRTVNPMASGSWSLGRSLSLEQASPSSAFLPLGLLHGSFLMGPFLDACPGTLKSQSSGS